MLLACLQRQAVCRSADAIDRYADQPARQRALQGVLHGHIGGVRTAISHRHAETLHRAIGDIGAQLSWRSEQCQRKRIGRDDGNAAGLLDGANWRAPVAEVTERSRILQNRAEQVGCGQVARGIADNYFPAQRLRASANDRDRLRVRLAVDKEPVRLRCGDPLGERHRFCPRGSFVKERGVRNVEAGQVGRPTSGN